MCNDFECVHDHCGICSFSDKNCEGESCVFWQNCTECREVSGCFPEN
nr:MAG TPA: hypothetical protein [Caudoviricetes sp.]